MHHHDQPGTTTTATGPRAELARCVPPGEFPADARKVRELAATNGAPAALRAELTRLPDAEYAGVGEVWEALGHG